MVQGYSPKSLQKSCQISEHQKHVHATTILKFKYLFFIERDIEKEKEKERLREREGGRRRGSLGGALGGAPQPGEAQRTGDGNPGGEGRGGIRIRGEGG